MAEAVIRAMEICSCAGGMALGFRRAGIEFGLVVDRDEDACSSYTHNLGHAPLRMDLRDLLRLAKSGWRPEHPLDLLVADPPCQPWSTAGKQKGLADERDCLPPLIELVEILQPRAFLLGNVPGLEHVNAEDALRDTVGGLSYRGYCIDHVVLDAADYGVPQRRIRPFWFCHRGGPCITWPSATHGPPSTQLAIGGTELLPWVTCRQALCDLPLAELGKVRNLRPVKPKNGGGGHPWSQPDKPANTICARADGGSGGGDVLHVGYPPSPNADGLARSITTKPDHKGNKMLIGDDDRPLQATRGFPPSDPDLPGRTVTTRASGGGNRMVVDRGLAANRKHPASKPDAPSHTVGAKARANGASVMEWPWDRPSTAVCSTDWIAQPGHVHPKGDPTQVKAYQAWRAVVLSERARARLQSFPDWLCGCNGGYPIADLERLKLAMEDGSGPDVRISEVCQTCWLPRRPWKFSGKTKGSRNAQIGMAMPPLLAEAIARSVVHWFSIRNEG